MSNSAKLFNRCLSLPAWCPACGKQSLLRASDKSLQCKQCHFLYYHNVAATSSAIIETPDHYLMVRRAHDPCEGMLDFPGGFIEKHETAELALQRELKEELGLTRFDQLNYLCNFTNTYHYAGIDYFTMDLYFLIHFEEQPDMVANDDVAGYEWIEIQCNPVAEIGFQSVKNACEFYQRFKQQKSGGLK